MKKYGTVDSSETRSDFDIERRAELLKLAHFGRKFPASGRNGLVVTSNPLVSQVAIDVLREGGNAVDAIVAASVAQTVVEPSMGGLCGCWSMLYYHATMGKISYLNASNNAPLHLPIVQKEWDANASAYLRDGRSVTIPGFWAGIEEALRVYGSLSKKRLCAPAIDFARNGFEIDPFLWGFVFKCVDNVGISEQGREIYMPSGRTLISPGDTLYQKRAADLLERLVEEGNDYFYHGEFAQRFSRTVREAGGWVTPEDIASYCPYWDEPVHTTYHGYDYFGSPAPDYGGQMVAEIFNLLEQLDLLKMGPVSLSGEILWRMQQIIRLVKQENFFWHIDGNKPELERILSKELASERLASLPCTGLPEVGRQALGSNQLTVVDGAGNAATVLHTIIGTWTHGLYVDGIHIGATAGAYSTGIPGAGKRINLGCAPGMFLKNGNLKLVCGSPSASAVECVTQASTHILDFSMSIEDTVHQPRFGAQTGVLGEGGTIEADMPLETFEFLQCKRVPFQKVCPWYWVHGSFDGVVFDEHGEAHGCGDPRRNGQAFAV